jgi:nucleoside-diphosphate-sugar epimerase
MTILVTGATGRVGERFVPRLLRTDVPVRVLVRDASRAEALAKLGAEIVEGDLQDESARAKALANVDGVVHLAAVFRGASPDDMVAVNHQATVNLARAAQQAGARRFVFVTTTLTYLPGPQRPALETDELIDGEPNYPTTKAAADRALMRMHREEGLPLRVARLVFVYGDGDPHLAESVNFIRDWPLHQRFHLVHHADVAQALIRLSMVDELDGAVVNVGDDAPVTALELFSLNGEQPAEDARRPAAAAPVGRDSRHHPVPERAGSAALLPHRVYGQGRQRPVAQPSAGGAASHGWHLIRPRHAGQRVAPQWSAHHASPGTGTAVAGRRVSPWRTFAGEGAVASRSRRKL